jgi:hypothetical protein
MDTLIEEAVKLLLLQRGAHREETKEFSRQMDDVGYEPNLDVLINSIMIDLKLEKVHNGRRK